MDLLKVWYQLNRPRWEMPPWMVRKEGEEVAAVQWNKPCRIQVRRPSVCPTVICPVHRFVIANQPRFWIGWLRQHRHLRPNLQPPQPVRHPSKFAFLEILCCRYPWHQSLPGPLFGPCHSHYLRHPWNHVSVLYHQSYQPSPLRRLLGPYHLPRSPSSLHYGRLLGPYQLDHLRHPGNHISSLHHPWNRLSLPFPVLGPFHRSRSPSSFHLSNQPQPCYHSWS
mmetsp:Transcript_33078/g.69449  ORF Transcript_33078/g.69449 Transcript_33078/m.69449 type:complete len:223 (+) Transcript_33078:691-1359(+)